MEHIKQIVGDIQFREMRSTYQIGEKIPCSILRLSEQKPETGDWIGIYPVGWTQLTEFKVRKYVSVELIEKCRIQKLDSFTVVFEPSELPKETGVSFELVYVTRSAVVRGVSKSFRLETVQEHYRRMPVKEQVESTRYPTSLIDWFLGAQYEPLVGELEIRLPRNTVHIEQGKQVQMVSDVEIRLPKGEYQVGEKIPCSVLRLSERKPETGDWIGIYPVGWTQLTEFKVRKYVSVELIEKCRIQKLDSFTVVFEPSELPKETGVSFELVYVTRSAVVRGVSKSFRLETVQEHYRRMPVKEQVESTRYPTSLIDWFLGAEPVVRSTIKAEPVVELKKEWTRPELKEVEIKEEELLTALWQKVLNLPSNKEEQHKLTQELLVENMRLRSTLESKTEEILKAKKSHDELKMVNADLMSKLNTLEKRIEKESVERENFVRKVVDALRPVMALHPERIMDAETLFISPKLE